VQAAPILLAKRVETRGMQKHLRTGIN
jgi:hypothetical protein